MQLREDFVAQIDLDVGRTFAALKDNVFIERLTRVLIAYANRNPSLGYLPTHSLVIIYATV
jgi:hypothetical protein